jgi:autotransporter-associated beta strand protein
MRLLLAVLGATLFGTAGLHAQFTWTGAAGDNKAMTAGNWLGGVAPVGNGTDDLIFGNSAHGNPDLPINFSVHNVTYSANTTGYYLGHGGGTNLTLTGDVTSTFGSTPYFVFLPDTLTLSAGTHIFTAGNSDMGGDLYVFGSLAGSGGLVKTGAKALIISSPDNASTYTGNIDLQAGMLNVAGDGSLGTGTVTMDGGQLNIVHYDSDHTVKLTNNFLFSGGAYFGSDFGLPVRLTITGSAAAKSGVTVVNLSADSFTQVTLEGGVGETSLGTKYVLSGAGTITFGGPGANTYTGGTEVDGGSTLVFRSAAPTTGQLVAGSSGYIGTEVTANMQTGFLNLFDQSNTNGIVGFDSPIVGSPVAFSGNIDLTGFASAVRIGTSSAAIFTGTITPQGSTYQFGGSGTLTLTSALTDSAGSRSVTVSDGLQLFLSGPNTYTGGTSANFGAVIFTGAGSFPGSGALSASPGGYLGQTETADVSAAAFIANFDIDGMHGVAGFDSSTTSSARTVSEAIDLTGSNYDVFIGTSTSAILNGLITPAGSDYQITGFRNGQLVVNSVLSGSHGVVIGLAQANLHYAGLPSVTLNGSNTYTGGTTLQSGQLVLGSSTALGPNTLTVAYYGANPTGLSTNVGGLTIANDINFGSGNHDFTLRVDYDFTLSGTLSSDYGSISKVSGGTVTFSGNNAGLHSDLNTYDGKVIFTTDTAAGTGSLYLSGSGEVDFTSAAPAIGELSGDGGTTLSLGAGTYLTINQANNDANVYSLITGSGGIIKTGNAALTFQNANDYPGGTTITAGTLIAGNDQALGTGPITINGGHLGVSAGVTLSNTLTFGGTGNVLGGNGTISSPVMVDSHVVLSPGDSPGTLTFANTLTWAPGGEYDWQLQTVAGGAGTGWDLISISSGYQLNLGSLTPGSFTLKVISLDGTGSLGFSPDFSTGSPYSFVIASASGGITGFNAANFTINASGFSNLASASNFALTVSGNDLVLNFTPVPEPSTYGLLGLGLAMAALGRRRQRNLRRRLAGL